MDFQCYSLDNEQGLAHFHSKSGQLAPQGGENFTRWVHRELGVTASRKPRDCPLCSSRDDASMLASSRKESKERAKRMERSSAWKIADEKLKRKKAWEWECDRVGLQTSKRLESTAFGQVPRQHS